MNLYERFLTLPIDRECLGLEPRDTDIAHFCTPRDAKILGWAGVDGVHYCTVPLLGKTVFAVSPMDGPPYVRPIARNFADLLSLLLACGSMDALAQVYMMDDVRFAAYIRDNRPLPAQQAALDCIAGELGITPMDEPYEYLSELQNGFCYPNIPYTDAYYDLTGEMPPAVFTVGWNGGFGDPETLPYTELPIGRTALWGEDRWHIPAVYQFEEGLVVDLCIEIDPERVRRFIEKWDLLHEADHRYTDLQRRQIEQDNPLSADFRASLRLHGEKIDQRLGSGCSWIAPDCLDEMPYRDADALAVLDHYGLDPFRCWNLYRISFPCTCPDVPTDLILHLERRSTDLPASSFSDLHPGSTLVLTHPLTGEAYTLTVQELAAQQMAASRFADPELEFPTHYTAMTYTLTPDLPRSRFSLRDCSQGDPVRRKTGHAHGAAAIGIIGGASAPGILVLPDGRETTLHIACSSLHFAPAAHIEWQFSFMEKLTPDLDLPLID